TAQAYTYAYDRFGNRWQQNGPHSSQPGFDANNHMVPGLGVTYDAAGNESNDGTTAYTYDSENRIITATNSANGASSYLYDADGRRIRKATVAGGTVDFLYDLGGHEISPVNSAGVWTRGEIYAGGRHLGTYTGGKGGNTYFTFADWLGAERVRSLAGATTSCETITSLPFGDGQTTTGSCGNPSPMHFTGKERDSESGLNNFGARYDSSQYGRFMTPDSTAYSGLKNPQSWNLYAYTLNNPLRFVDPTGHTVECKTKAADCLSAAQAAVGKNAAGQLSTKTTQSFWQKIFGGSTTTLQINGSEADFRGASGNASKLADLIDSKTNFGVSIQHPGDPQYSSVINSIVGGGAKFDLQGG